MHSPLSKKYRPHPFRAVPLRERGQRFHRSSFELLESRLLLAIDAKLSIGDVAASAGQDVTVPVNLDMLGNALPANDPLESVEVAVEFDNTKLQLVSISLGSLLPSSQGWASPSQNSNDIATDNQLGALVITTFSTTGLSGTPPSSDLLDIEFQVAAKATGTTVVNLVNQYQTKTTELDQIDSNDNITALSLSPAPTTADNDPVDGTVTIAAISNATVQPVAATEGTAYLGEVASFSDSADTLAADFTATIDWGDGQPTSQGTVAAGAGGFAVNGTHTYSEEGTEPVTVTITDTKTGQTVTPSANVVVSDASLAATASPVAAQGGVAFNGPIATFKDDDPAGIVSDYRATIDWGDHSAPSTVTGSQITEAGGIFTLRGSHVYAATGTYNMTVTIDDVGGAAATVNPTATVLNEVIQPTGTAVAATEGATFTGSVATFTDSDNALSSGDFTVNIAWGDGATSSGAVTAAAGGGFFVDGTHVYLEEGTQPISVTITSTYGISASAASTATIADAPLHASGTTITATEGAVFAGTGATFTDADPAGLATDYTASVDWGDGTTTVATISGPVSNGLFTITGSHLYAAPGTYTVRATVADSGGSTATTAGTADISGLIPTGTTVTGTPDAVLSATVATFTDGDASLRASDFSASINWGDGTTSVGTVTESAGTYTVAGTTVYTEQGVFPIATTISQDGISVIANGTAVIEVPLMLAQDIYVVGSGTINVPAANGVLENDIGPSRLTVISSTVPGVEGGTFVFNADGSFTYTPPVNSLRFDYTQFEVQDAGGDVKAQFVYVLSQPAGVVWKFFEQVLHRDPAPSDLTFFIPLLAEYGSGVLAADFFESDELLIQLITGFYEQYLDRAPQGNDLSFWEAAWRQYGGPELIIAQFASSAEFNTLANNLYAQAGASPAPWVTGLYERILQRAPQPGIDVPFWVNVLNGGTTEGQVALDFVAGQEAFSDHVTGWFNEYLERAPSSAELTQYVNQMLGGASDRTIEEEITNLPEYANNPAASTAGTGVPLPDYLPAKNTAKAQATVAAADAVFGQLA